MSVGFKVYWESPSEINVSPDTTKESFFLPLGGVSITEIPVTSVNGKIGDVVLNANDVEADALGSAATVQMQVSQDLAAQQSEINALSLLVDTKANSTAVLQALGEKADKSYVDTQDSLLQDQIDLKADAIAVSQSLATKADLIGGLIPASQLPSFVDDVLNFPNLVSFPSLGEDGKIYIAQDVNKTYRWSGTQYVEVGGGGVALGETSSTAYRGDRGKIAYDHSLSQGNPHNTTTSEITEGSKLFFTAERVRQTTLDGFIAATATPITAADNVLQALGKAQGQINKAWSANWVNVETIGTLYSAIDLHNLEAAKIDGMLFFRGWFRNSTAAIQTSNPILNITDTSYHVQHDDVDAIQTISSSALHWGTSNGTIRYSVNITSRVQQLTTGGILNAANAHRKIGSGLWCAGVLKNP